MSEHSGFSTGGYVYGAEYEPNPRLKQFFGDDLGDQNVPCAVCNNKQRLSSIMIPGKTSCNAGWNMEYSGYLMSGLTNRSLLLITIVLIKMRKLYQVGPKTKMANFSTLSRLDVDRCNVPLIKTGGNWHALCVPNNQLI